MTSLDEFFEKERIPEKIEVEIPRIGITFKLHSLKASVTRSIRIEVRREFQRINPNLPPNDAEIEESIGDRLLLASIEEPNLLDPRFLAYAKVPYPHMILGEILLDGELNKLKAAYYELNSGNQLSNSKILEAKN